MNSIDNGTAVAEYEVEIREVDFADVGGVLFVVGDTAEAALLKEGAWQERHPILITRVFVETANEDEIIIEHKRIKACKVMGGDEALPESDEAFVVSDDPEHGWKLSPMRQDDYDAALVARQGWYAATYPEEWHQGRAAKE